MIEKVIYLYRRVLDLVGCNAAPDWEALLPEVEAMIEPARMTVAVGNPHDSSVTGADVHTCDVYALGYHDYWG